MKLRSEQFLNADGSTSHWSVVQVDDDGDIVELATCVMHNSKEDCDKELTELAADTSQ